jgi:anthranilate/para-aminobenzoate synthase component I
MQPAISISGDNMAYHSQPFSWCNPLQVAEALQHQSHFACLYSGLHNQQISSTSYVAWESLECLQPASYNDISMLSARSEHSPGWFGYMGYEFAQKNNTQHSFIDFPITQFHRYGHVMIFDHDQKTVTYKVHHASKLKPLSNNALVPLATAETDFIPTSLASSLSKTNYLQSVSDTLNHIAMGNFYQANITRKFFGELNKTPCSTKVFLRLCQISPAPYSALMRWNNQAIISSSPEHFLSVNSEGHMITSPIKGSAPRGNTPESDAIIARDLQNSDKNNAENRMITDLMRNDFSKVCNLGTVRVSKTSALHSYRTIHHLISTIEGNKQPAISLGNVIEATFPPGSMTGAPKRAAMEWCNQQESMKRGAYSGILGWIGPHNTCDFSVVIRTILLDEKRFEFQVGGGIVADSTPELEWLETLTKAQAVAQCFGISGDALRCL